MNIPTFVSRDLWSLCLEGPTKGDHITCDLGEHTPVPGFRLKRCRPGVGAVRMSALDIHVLVRMLESRVGSFPNDLYKQDADTAIACFAAAGLQFDALYTGQNGVLRVRGKVDDVNVALSGIALIPHGGRNRTCVLQVIAADVEMPAHVHWDVNDARKPTLLIVATWVTIRIDNDSSALGIHHANVLH